jgi:hypothetical protein
MTRRYGPSFLAFVAFALSVPAAAQQVVAPQLDGAALHAKLAAAMARPGRTMPADMTALDTMLHQHDWTHLAARLHAQRNASQMLADMDWEQTHIYDGAGFLIAYSYMIDLWHLGSSLPPESGAGLQQTAAMMFLYSLDLTALDGPKCADVTAPGHRSDQLFGQNRALVSYIMTLPRAKRMEIGSISLSIEAATAALRSDDGVLCSGGMTEIEQGLKAHGTKPLPQVPHAPGMYGKTYAVPPAPGYLPQFVPEGVWRPKQAAARASMAMTLTRMLTVPADSQPPPPAK